MISLRTPARAALRPTSVHASASVWSATVSVPGNATCSVLSPTFMAGNTSNTGAAGCRANAARTSPSLIRASVARGRCGPCCSTAATGSSATVCSASMPAKSLVVQSCQNPLCTRFPFWLCRPAPHPAGCSKRRQPWIMRALGATFRSFEETDMSRPERAVAVDNEVQELMAKARTAQAAYEAFSQEQVDAIVRGMAKFVYDNAEKLARMAVDETGIGNYEDKVLKKKGKARVIWNSLKGKKSRGMIGEDAEKNLVLVAKLMGVVAAVCPFTNPVATPMCNGMFALKTGNAVIFAPHPKAQKCTDFLTNEFMKVVKQHGGPDHLIQTIKNGSVEKTQELMRAADVVVATGGGAMVKSAYSSCKPSYGVAAGNVPVIIDRGVDMKDAVGKIVTGAAFDNRIICSHEQFVLTPEESYDETVKLFQDTGKVWFTADEKQIQKLREIVFPDGHLNKDAVGKSPREIGAMAGIDVPASARIILLPAKGAGMADGLATE